MQNKVNNRSFGLLFFGVFFIIGVWPVTYAGETRLWSLILSIIFLISGLLNLKFLSPFKKTWIKFGEIIGKIISPIVLASIFFLILTPISLILRIFGTLSIVIFAIINFALPPPFYFLRFWDCDLLL